MNAVTPLKCVSMSNKECRVRPVIVNLRSNPIVLLSINAMAAAVILITHAVNYAFLMVLKT